MSNMAFLEVNGCRLYSTAGGHVQRDEVEKSSLGKYSLNLTSFLTCYLGISKIKTYLRSSKF